jgi:hypothetical protein
MLGVNFVNFGVSLKKIKLVVEFAGELESHPEAGFCLKFISVPKDNLTLDA